MRLKDFASQLRPLQTDEDLTRSLVLSIFKLEEVLAISAADSPKVIEQLGEVLTVAFLFANENKIEINHAKIEELDLDHWKDNVVKYKTMQPINAEAFLYTLRNSLRYVMDSKDEKMVKAFLFEMLIKTFLFIDFLNLSIDTILQKALDKEKIRVSAENRVAEKLSEKKDNKSEIFANVPSSKDAEEDITEGFELKENFASVPTTKKKLRDKKED